MGWSNADFDARAAELATAFQAGQGQNGADLNELVTKVARDANLNEEQIRRLCRAVNVHTFEAKFAALQGDKDVRFPVADEVAVIGRLRDDAVVKTASVEDTFPDLPDEMARLRGTHDVPQLTKVACFDEDARRAASYFRDVPVDVLYERAKRRVADLTTKRASADARWFGYIEKASYRLRPLYAELDAFEKNALAVLGPEVYDDLNAALDQANQPRFEAPREKLAALADRLEGRPDAFTKLLKCAMDARAEVVALTSELADATQARDALEKRYRAEVLGA